MNISIRFLVLEGYKHPNLMTKLEQANFLSPFKSLKNIAFKANKNFKLGEA